MDINAVKAKYDAVKEIWPQDDPWHIKSSEWTKRKILREIKTHRQTNSYEIVNAGSGGNDYGLPPDWFIHVDISLERIKDKPRFLVGNIESISLSKSSADMIICVGNSLNYCNEQLAIQDFARVLKPGGILLLEFETSQSFEWVGTPHFKRDKTQVLTFYQNKEEHVYAFSPTYIKKVLISCGFQIEKSDKFHLVSTFVLWLTGSPAFSARFTFCDKWIKHIPILSEFPSNYYIVAKYH